MTRISGKSEHCSLLLPNLGVKPTSNLGATTEPRKIINHTDSFLPHTYAFLPNLNPSDRETVDTIEATVPEDGREPLKKRIRDRDDDDDESSRKRPRANTLALLSAEPGELPEVPDSPPPVKEDLAKYTRERVKAGLRYINHTTATGKITPRTLTFLNLSKEAHKVALESETPSEKAVAVVQEYDRVYHAEAFLLQPQSAQALQRISNLTKLRRLQILTHYRDYIRPNLHDVRANNFKESSQGGRSKQAAAGTQHIRPPPRSWLQELAETDPSALRKHTGTEECANLVREYITECDWAQLGRQLHRDLNDLTNIEYDRKIVALFRTVIRSLRDRYFDLDGLLDPPGMWVRNDYARELGNMKREAEARKAAKKAG